MLTTPGRALPLRERLRGSWRILLKEVTAFGLVGGVAFIVQFVGFNLLLHRGLGPVTANAIAMAASTVVAYLGNRNLSFSHRARTGLGREAGFFFGINGVAFAFSELLVALFAHPLGYKNDKFVINVALLVSIVIGTMFRFWAYKRFVFLHPDKVHSPDVDLDEELAEN